MFTLIAVVTCLAPNADIITIATPRSAVIELASGTQTEVTQAHHIWSTGSRSFETEYGTCTIGKMEIKKQ